MDIYSWNMTGLILQFFCPCIHNFEFRKMLMFPVLIQNLSYQKIQIPLGPLTLSALKANKHPYCTMFFSHHAITDSLFCLLYLCQLLLCLHLFSPSQLQEPLVMATKLLKIFYPPSRVPWTSSLCCLPPCKYRFAISNPAFFCLFAPLFFLKAWHWLSSNLLKVWN